MRHVTLNEMVGILLDRKGCCFVGINAEYSMDDKGKMLKRNNPFIGKGIRKLAETVVMVTFDYDKSMERRGDEAAGTGNWSQAVTRADGSLTPLSIHKADIGSDSPRYYLRGEFRQSKSRYVHADGTALTDNETTELKTFLPKRAPQTVEFHTVTMSNVKRLTIDKEDYILAA